MVWVANFKVDIHVCKYCVVCVCTMTAPCEAQKRVLDAAVELELEIGCGCWEQNTDPPQGLVVLKTKQSPSITICFNCPLL